MNTNITIWVQERGGKSWIDDNDVKYFPNEEKYKDLLLKINEGKEVEDSSSDSKVGSYVVTGYFLEKDEVDTNIPFMALVGPISKNLVLRELEKKINDLGFHLYKTKIWSTEKFIKKHWKTICTLGALVILGSILAAIVLTSGKDSKTDKIELTNIEIQQSDKQKE